MKSFESVKKEVLDRVRPKKEDLDRIKKHVDKFLKEVESEIKKQKVKTQIFVGGSYSKNTLIKKDYYDIDIFLRYESEDGISYMTEKILGKTNYNFEKLHGSRDYFRVKVDKDLFIEVVPVINIKKPENEKNITDLSVFHVTYIKKQIKSKKIEDEIRIAKAFCHSQKCYGAESYIKGFSGYSLELLISHYKSFLKFATEISKSKGQIIIDTEKKFKNKGEIMMNLNSSKLNSPIILIDPTFKYRNALAGLSKETFERFKKTTTLFLKKPSIDLFEDQKTDFNKLKENSLKKKLDFVLLEVETNKQEGDIAGSKLLKFKDFLFNEISKRYDVKDSGFEYNNGKKAKVYFSVKPKNEILFKGPQLSFKKDVIRFKKNHKKTFVKSGRIYANEKINESLRVFLSKWTTKNRNQMDEMSIIGIKSN